jgi:hypothetical protein
VNSPYITILPVQNSNKSLSCVGFSENRKLNLLDRFDPNLSLFPENQDRVLDSKKHRFRRCTPWSAIPRLRVIPGRLGGARRREHLREIEARCEKSAHGCWLYPAVRDESYPYLDVTGDDGGREQWSARRYVWALVNGDIPEGGIILGRCPPKACVLPEHQWLWVPPRQLQLLGDRDGEKQ